MGGYAGGSTSGSIYNDYNLSGKADRADLVALAGLFDSMFELVTPDEGAPYIRAKYSFASVGEIVNHASDGLIVGSPLLGAVDILSPEDGQMLVYRNGRWVNESLAYGGGGLDESELASYLSRYGYVTNSALGNYVTLNTAQTIAGVKTFTDVVNVSNDGIAIGGNIILRNNGAPNNNTVLSSTGGDLFLRPCGTFDSTGEVRIKPNGTITAGGLTVPKVSINSAGSNGIITADTSYNMYMEVSGKALLVLNGVENSIRSAGSLANTVSLGTASTRWSNVYTNTLNVSSNALVSNLNADMLDGLHSNQFMRESVVGKVAMNANDLFAAWTIYRPDHDLNTNTAAWTNFPVSKPPGGFSLINLQSGNYKHQLYLDYNHNNIFIRRQYYNNGVLWSGWTRLVNEQDNIASATKLQTERGIFGNKFDGSADVTGPRVMVNGANTAGSYPNIMFHIPNTNYTQIQMDGSGTLYVRDGGNQAGALKNFYAGSFYSTGWFRSVGNNGWYNETYGGGIYQDSANWVKLYQKPLYIGTLRNIGANHFNVALKMENSNNMGFECQGGNYVMGMGCHNNGSWYWWRGTNGETVANKSYVMQFDGTTWNFTGNIFATGEIINHSDRRLKFNIVDIKARGRLRPVSYTKDGSRHIGLIAQDVRPLCPEVVREGEDPRHLLGLNYIGALCYGFAGVYAEIDALKEEVKNLRRLLTR